MPKRYIIAIQLLALIVLFVGDRAEACSVVGCTDRGIEVNSSFSVNLSHDDRPLSGVLVEVTTFRGDSQTTVFSETTALDGTVYIASLPPGDYWISAELLGISAAYHCFHVETNPSSKAKRALSYEWGESAPGTRQVRGTLIDLQPAQGGTPIWNITHRVPVPVTGASLTLRNPTSGAVYRTSSDSTGGFAFGDVASGIYVLHIEGGIAGERGYDSTDQLLEVGPKEQRDTLLLTRRDAGGGSCGGTTLELSEAPAR